MTLWCVNILGPDDVLAMPDRAAALEEANALNRYFAKLDEKRHEYDPVMRAVVIEWPHSPESHAHDLAKRADMRARYSPPQTPQGCTRSHPHENMNADCERLTTIARERNSSSNAGVSSIATSPEANDPAHPDYVAAQAAESVYLADHAPTNDAPERVQLPEKARAGVEVLRDVVDKLLTTSRYVDEKGEATLALADMAACIADPPFKLNDVAGVQEFAARRPVAYRWRWHWPKARTEFSDWKLIFDPSEVDIMARQRGHFQIEALAPITGVAASAKTGDETRNEGAI